MDAELLPYMEVISVSESWHGLMQRDYEEFKVRINGLVAMAQKVPEDGWTMQDGTPWPGNNVRDHPGMIQVRGCFLMQSGILLNFPEYQYLFHWPLCVIWFIKLCL